MREKRHSSLISFTKTSKRENLKMKRIIATITTLVLLIAPLQANYLNDIESGTFVDIGKLSGFEEVETPKVETLAMPTYTLVENIIAKHSRQLDLDRCFLGRDGIESCLKDEVECDGHVRYGDNTVVKRSSAVVDYVNPKVVTEESVFKCYLYIDGSGSDRLNGKGGCWAVAGETCLTVKSANDLGLATLHFNDSCTLFGVTYPEHHIFNGGEYSAVGSGTFIWDTRYGQSKHTCSEGLTYDESKMLCEKIDCDEGYLYNETKELCEKSISFNYYEYSCDSEYETLDTGRTFCSKTDTDRTADNSTELAQPCNSPTPPSTNCYYKWNTCPVDSSKTCAFKGQSYSIYVPLKKFFFEDNGYFKPWEYGRARGFSCTTLTDGNSQEKYDCQYGIKEIDATSFGKLCFMDVQGYNECISYEDYSDCRLDGKITSIDGPLKGVFVDSDDKTLVSADPSQSNGTIVSNCLLNGKIGFSDVGLGVISAKSEKNRLTFWNSYDSEMVGFLDFIPQLATTNQDSAIALFNFEKHSASSSIDTSITGDSKEVIRYKDSNITLGKEGYGLEILDNNSDVVYIESGEDLTSLGQSPFGFSFWYKPTKQFSNLRKIVSEENNKFYIKQASNLRLKLMVNINGTERVFYGSNTLGLNEWNYITALLVGSEFIVYINDSSQVFSLPDDFNGDGLGKIIIGNSTDGSQSVEGIFDTLSFYNNSVDEDVHLLHYDSDLNIEEYLSFKNNEIREIIGKSFGVLYKSFDDHVYMVSDDKITSSVCSLRVKDTRFAIAQADARISQNSDVNRVVADSVIKNDCKSSPLIACDEDPSSQECINGNLTTISFLATGAVSSSIVSRVNDVVDEVKRACQEKKLLIGLSKESEGYEYTFSDSSERRYCIIESGDTEAVDFFDIEYIEKEIDNKSNLVDKYVCSEYDCSTEHICGVASCPKDTNGTIGVPSSFTGCTDNECQFSSPYYAECGNYSGCSNARDIISSSIELGSSITKEVKVITDGYDRKIAHEVLVVENFSSTDNGWSNSAIKDFGGDIGSILGRLTGATEKTFDFGSENAGAYIKISFKAYIMDTWDHENFETWVNGVKVIDDVYYGGALNDGDVNLGDFSNYSNGFNRVTTTRDRYHLYTLNSRLDSSGKITVKFNSTLSSIVSDESYGIDELIISHRDTITRSREILIDGTRELYLYRGWNLIIMDENFNISEKASFDTYGNTLKVTELKDKIEDINDTAYVIFATYDEPSRNVSTNSDLLDVMEDFGFNRSVLEKLEYRSSYLYAGQRGEEPLVEKYNLRYEDGMDVTFNLEDKKIQNKCYQISCSGAATLNLNTKTCVKVGCDDKSILKGDKCISTIVK